MRIVLTGASGQLGAYVLERLTRAGHDVLAWSGQATGERSGLVLRPVDLTSAGATEDALARDDPDAIIHVAAMSRAEDVRLDPVRGSAVNVEATARLAGWCGRRGRRIVYTSTDLVFDGSNPWNREDDPAAPLLAYGRTKLEGESFVRAVPDGLVARLSLLFGPSRSGQPTYLDRTIEGLRRGESQTLFSDEFRTPLDLATAAEALVLLAESTTSGLIHVGGRQRLSRYELGLRVAMALGLDPALVRANRQRDVTFPEPRPADVSLDTSRLESLLPDLARPDIEEAARSLWGR
jgi:dTDP-4-dehydrorhamnose reductase